MKVLWITFWGTWTKPLLNNIKNHCEIEVIVPSEGIESYKQDSFEGVKLHYITFSKSNGVYVDMNEKIFSRYKTIIDTFHPDIIHVHGTEKNLAQVQNFIKQIPVVISIQGLLSGCLKYNLAFLSRKDMLPHTSLKNLIGHGGLMLAERMCKRGVKNYETDILTKGRYFFGRTLWDKAHIQMSNPESKYFTGEEILRPSFYEKKGKWSLDNCERHTIMMPSGYNPLKGMHIAIQAIAYLKQFYPDVVLKVPGIPQNMLNRKGAIKLLIGEEFIEYCLSKIKKNHLEDNIRFLPYLNEEEMVFEMLMSNAFLSCSTIDNSSNAIGEATMLGIPLVATAVGGVLSILEDEVSALMVPSGDAYVMALQLKRLFDSDELCKNISINEVRLAENRHDQEHSSMQYINAYQKIINNSNEF
jgi:glycosyltransferase involved in cell wall biosynthesis